MIRLDESERVVDVEPLAERDDEARASRAPDADGAASEAPSTEHVGSDQEGTDPEGGDPGGDEGGSSAE